MVRTDLVVACRLLPMSRGALPLDGLCLIGLSEHQPAAATLLYLWQPCCNKRAQLAQVETTGMRCSCVGALSPHYSTSGSPRSVGWRILCRQNSNANVAAPVCRHSLTPRGPHPVQCPLCASTCLTTLLLLLCAGTPSPPGALLHPEGPDAPQDSDAHQCQGPAGCRARTAAGHHRDAGLRWFPGKHRWLACASCIRWTGKRRQGTRQCPSRCFYLDTTASLLPIAC